MRMDESKSRVNLITVLGHTAAGKTRFAACLADRLGAEVISADSRQVYRRMDLGTGKDYGDYLVNGREVPVHLVDIQEPGYEYNVYEYQKDFLKVYAELKSQAKTAVLCGGSGLYIEAVLKGYRLIRVPLNPGLRGEFEQKSMKELAALLASFKKLHNKTDTVNRKRVVRALEIEYYYRDHPDLDRDYPDLQSLILGLRVDRETRRERISGRLKERLKAGLIEEVEGLLKEGIQAEKLKYYGLEYRYITEYLSGKNGYEEMLAGLETAIHRFAKRQMTWFRGMERRGLKIYWLDGKESLEGNLVRALELYRGGQDNTGRYTPSSR